MNIHGSHIVSIVAGVMFTLSCIEPCDLGLDVGDSRMPNTLCVAANARIIGSELSFSAAVAPVRPLWSGASESESYPLDNLVLELIVDGVSYSCDSLVKDSRFNSGQGFIIDKIPVDSDAPEIEMKIRDRAGNYATASATRKAPDKPEMQVEVSATLSEDESFLPIAREEEFPKSNWHDLQCPDSLYRARIAIDSLEKGLHYYLLAVEFEFSASTFVRRYDYEKRKRIIDETKLTSLGYFPFVGDNEHFYDSKITSSISGFPAYFGNVFCCDGLGKDSRTVTIQFVNPALELYKKRVGDTPLTDANFYDCHFGTNSQSPFHIYLCELSAETYEYYKTIQHQVCSSSSIFDGQSTLRLPSNIEGGIGYFSIHNMQEFFYVDLNLYNDFIIY